MADFNVKIKLDEIEDLKVSGDDLAKAMDQELSRFQEFFMAKGGNEPLIRMERSLLKTYLAWKLLYEDGCPASQA